MTSSKSVALLRLEARRALRNRRTLMFSSVLPAVFFLAFSASNDTSTVGGLTIAPYIMVSMATYGAMNALFTGGGVIAAERAVGWNRQLRIAGVGPRSYIPTKVLTSYLTAVLGLLVVFVLGGTVKQVHLDAVTWLEAGASILLGLLPVAAMGLAIGYAARPQSLQPLFGIGSALLALLGGMWAPAENFPGWLRTIAEALPTYWSADAGRAVLRGSWLGWHGVLVLSFWTVVFAAVAARAYRRDSLRPGAAGTT